MQRFAKALSIVASITLLPVAAQAQFNSSMSAFCIDDPCTVVVFELITDPGWLVHSVSLSTTTGGLGFNPTGPNTVVSTDFDGHNDLNWNWIDQGGNTVFTFNAVAAAPPIFLRLDLDVVPGGVFDVTRRADFTYGANAYNPSLNNVSGASFGTAHVTPEPVTVALMATGLLGIGGVGFFRRRRLRADDT